MKPWTTGPRELLEHAIEHFEKGSPFDHRASFIGIDNAVEVIIKTYLGLPRRIRKSDGPSRRKLTEASNSFPELLDLFEEYGADNLEGIELGDIEWYHRIRNTLYHDGNGVTVDEDKVDSYLQIAVILFNNLFEEDFKKEVPLEPSSVVGEIVLRSAQLEHNLGILYRKHFPEEPEGKVPMLRAVSRLSEKGILPPQLLQQIDESRRVRNEAVHNTGNIDVQEVKKAAEVLWDIVRTIAGFI